jgi:hypothetical protein
MAAAITTDKRPKPTTVTVNKPSRTIGCTLGKKSHRGSGHFADQASCRGTGNLRDPNEVRANDARDHDRQRSATHRSLFRRAQVGLMTKMVGYASAFAP